MMLSRREQHRKGCYKEHSVPRAVGIEHRLRRCEGTLLGNDWWIDTKIGCSC